MVQIKRMDFGLGQGARRRHSSFYGNDEQRRPKAKDAVLCAILCDSLHSGDCHD